MLDHIYDIALTLCKGIGPKGARALIEQFGDAKYLFTTSQAKLFDMGLKPKIVQSLSDCAALERAESIAAMCAHKGVKVLVRGVTPEYPPLLLECSDAPHVMYAYGDLDLTRGKWVSIVGTRKASKEGLDATEHIVKELSESYDDAVVVSGLAFGIDKQAHLMALHYKVPTVAILPGWVLDITPTSHIELARRIILSGGAILSDMPLGTKIGKASFLSRNRLVAGVSSVTIVVESPEKSGTTSTANIALSYDRAVFAIPGRSSDANAYGTNLLIKSGRAILYQDVSDLAVELGWVRLTAREFGERYVESMPDFLRDQYKVMPESEPITLDVVVDLLEISIGEASSAMMQLENLGMVKSIPGGMYIRLRY